MSSSEIIRCKECGQIFDTIESLREHEEAEKVDRELQNKGLWLHEVERDPVNGSNEGIADYSSLVKVMSRMSQLVVEMAVLKEPLRRKN